MAIEIVGAEEVLSNPVVAFLLRAALGVYIVYMARGFYIDPLAYFRKWMPRLPEYLWMKLAIRYCAVFCVWGGCFILATAMATQILGLYGWSFAILLIVLAAVATYFLLPQRVIPLSDDEAGGDNVGRMK